MTGSLLVPVKALVLNVLSLTATFGAMVWIFQDGHFADQLHFTPTGTIDVFTPILMFCIAFGLSMDYEVFLLSRIKEEYDLERDNERAVAIGLAEDRPDRHRRRAPAHDRVHRHRDVGGRVRQDVRHRPRARGARRRVPHPRHARPRVHAARRRLNWWAPRWLRRWHLRFGIWENEPIALLDREFETSVR